MSFKAQIATTDYNTAKNRKYRTYTSPFKYDFTKNKIHLPTKSITVLRQENQIFDKSNYTLIPLEKDDLSYSYNSQFQAKFDNGIVINLVTTPLNTFFLKWTHKRTWINKYKVWIAQTIIASLITFLITYFFSYRIGKQDGFKEGVKSVKISDTLNKSQAKPITQQIKE